MQQDQPALFLRFGIGLRSRFFEHSAGVQSMPDNHAVALVLTFAEAGALFEAANVGLNRRAELGQRGNAKATEALLKIARGMGRQAKVDGAVVMLLPPDGDDT